MVAFSNIKSLLISLEEVGRLRDSYEDNKILIQSESIDVKFPNQGESDRGSHINISGGGIAKYSKNKENALTFLEFLVSEEAQNLYARINFEYPVLEGIALPEALLLWGKFRADNIPIERIAELSPTAQKIIDEVGW